MPASTPLPRSVEDITPGWLTAALAAGPEAGTGGDRSVRNLEVTHIVGGTATKVLLTASLDGDPAGTPLRLCVKGGFVPELRAVMAPGYQAEARFYRDVAPALDAGLPRCWFADAEGDQGIVILDDLVALGARFCDARRPLRVDTVAAALDVLASWHSRPDITAPWLDAPSHLRPMVSGLLTPEHWDAYAARATSETVRSVLADRDRVGRAFSALWASEDGARATLVHGDANLTNVYLDAAGAPRFLDWQFASRGDALHDVALFVIGALSVEDRRTHERELLRGYLDARRDTPPSPDEAWLAYRRHPLHGATYALTPDEMQPADVRAALAERFAQAVLDLDTFALLGG